MPNFSDPHIPVVAREILQRMIRQFAAEYTSKSSPPQDSSPDQSLPDASSLSGAPPPPPASWPGRGHNPVLSKLLMAVQEAPLDLTVKKPSALPSDQGNDALFSPVLRPHTPCIYSSRFLFSPPTSRWRSGPVDKEEPLQQQQQPASPQPLPFSGRSLTQRVS